MPIIRHKGNKSGCPSFIHLCCPISLFRLSTRHMSQHSPRDQHNTSCADNHASNTAGTEPPKASNKNDTEQITGARPMFKHIAPQTVRVLETVERVLLVRVPKPEK